MEEEEQAVLQEKLQEYESVMNNRGEKQKDIMIQKKEMAKEYSEHILQRLEYLKIIEIVKTIETENNYMQKVKKIEEVRKEKEKSIQK